MSVVVDCSVTLAWVFADESSPAAGALLDRFRREPLVVPSLWLHEIANSLLIAERRRRLTPRDVESFIALLRALPIEVDYGGFDRALRVSVGLARDHALTAYDAAYLELAIRTGFPLATLDAALRRAAEGAGVATLPLMS